MFLKQTFTTPNVPTTISVYRAIRKSQDYLVKRYVASHPRLIDTPGPNGLTPLGSAIVAGNKDIVDILLNANANINLSCSITLRTPLHVYLRFL